MGNGIIGPSMSGFRPDTHHLKIQENHLFAFECAEGGTRIPTPLRVHGPKPEKTINL